MKKSAILFFLILFSLTTFAQKPKAVKKPVKKSTNFVKTTAVNVGSEKDEFENAVAQKSAAERIMALNKFVANFPKSNEKTRALELIISARAEIADEKLRLNDTTGGIELFKSAVKDAPNPVSDKLFTEILLQIPTNLFLRGQQTAAIEVAKSIEEKIEGNPNQLLGLATFYIGTENAAEARRLAEKAIAINPNLPAAYQTLGLASRVNFQLEEAANAYAKALELDANSIVSKRSLAEMKRATGKIEDALQLYREILAKDESNVAAQTGLTLSLFNSGKRAEAEAEMAKSFEKSPNNLPLLVGVAYWYAAHDEGAKAVEFAQKAITVEPRYTWAYIAMARGFLLQKRPMDAEKALLTARQYGNFPTIDYEMASVKFAAGFYREAAEELKKSFAVKLGILETQLGGRIRVRAKDFIDLLALERQASIFEPLAADSPEHADKIKSLFDFSQKLESPDMNESAISEAADEFTKGDDRMRVHRQIFAANRLLENKKAFLKVLELTKAAVGGVDSALDAPNPAAAILAEELYDSRRIAMIRGQLIIVPDVPRQTLLNIVRGRIEDISGWTLYQQGKTTEAVIRLKRAVSVLPEKSSWWRGSLWRLGTALDTEGKSKEALDAYVKSYTNAEPDVTKRIVIESVYQKLNGSLEGLDQKIGAKPVTASVEPNPQPPTEIVAQNSAKEIPTPESKPTPELKSTIEVQSSPTPELKTTPETSPTSELKATPEPSPEQKTTPAPTPSPTVEQTAQIEAEKKPTPELKPETTPTASPTPEIKTEKATPVLPTPELKIEPVSTVSPTPEPKSENAPAVLITSELKTENTPTVLPTPESSPEKKQTVENQTPEIKSDKSVKPLFEPIVITVPKTETAKPEVKSDELVAVAKPLDKKNDAKTERPRVVTVITSDALTEEKPQCKIIVSQESISLINRGGNLGILVGFEGAGDLKEITASSSSPNDIEVMFEPDIGAQSGRAFFVIKSISTNKGIYTVTFDAPCGRKNVLVKVR